MISCQERVNKYKYHLRSGNEVAMNERSILMKLKKILIVNKNFDIIKEFYTSKFVKYLLKLIKTHERRFSTLDLHLHFILYPFIKNKNK